MKNNLPSIKELRANGLNFFVGIAGRGPKLLFLTGTAGDLRKPNTPLSSQLVNDYTVLTFDQRGMGRSEKPDYAYSMRDYAEDAIAIVDSFGWKKIHLAGYSFGGMVAQEVAIRWPERVSRLVLMATTAGGAGGSSTAIEKFELLPEYERECSRLENLDLSFTPEWQTANPIAANARITARIEAESQYAHESAHAVGRKRQLEARSEHDTYDRLTSIQAPTLVMCGKRDGQAPHAAQKAMAARIENCVFKVVDGSHAMISENPNVYQYIAEFLSNR